MDKVQDERIRLEPNGDPFNIVMPNGERMLLARFEPMSEQRFHLLAQVIVELLNQDIYGEEEA